MIDVSLPVPADRPFPWRTVVACLTTIACLLGWQLETNRLRSNAVPIGLQAMMTYESLAGDGFMPGSNKTLLRVFVIPRIIASVIAEGKQPFLAAQYPEYREWRETPVVMDEHWPPIQCECLTPSPDPLVTTSNDRSAFHSIRPSRRRSMTLCSLRAASTLIAATTVCC